MQAGGSESLKVGQIGNRRKILEVLLVVEGTGERLSRSSSSSEKPWVENDSSSAPVDEEPETEDDR